MSDIKYFKYDESFKRMLTDVPLALRSQSMYSDCYIAVDGNSLIAFIEINSGIDNAAPEMYIQTTAEFRNLGVMRAFFPWAIKEYLDTYNDVEYLYSRINSKNVASLILHIKNGFEIEDITKFNNEVIVELYKSR